jgi:LuxR family maltose regulon positive regulatory protein
MVIATDRQDLLHTKLHRPRVTADLLHRPRLKAMLNSGLDRPLILVAAPAGFGKSTLLSAWLETTDIPYAWISLDKSDSDFSVFLAYFLAAVESLFPNTLPETRSFLKGVSLPAAVVVAHSLINELDRLERDFVLLLDDFHVIRDQSIHELISLLLQHPLQGMHLVIATRLEPPLPLAMHRARNQIVEIRGQDLRFTPAEIAAFVKQAIGAALTDDAIDVLADRTEGWPAGLRLATLTLRYGGDVDSRLVGLHAENRHVLDYLLREVLAQVPPAMRDFLLKTSILDQMCASLCQAVLGLAEPMNRLQGYLTWLEQANMFTVALDTRGEWYRYHHLFRDLLRDQLAQQASADAIADLHVRAGAWYADRGSLEEALQHMLLGGDMPGAVRLLATQRHALMDTENWQLHHRTLGMFPEQAVAAYPDLLVMAAWIARLGQSSSARVLELIDDAENLLAKTADWAEHVDHLRGEIDTLRVIITCEAAGDPEAVIALAERALATTPRAWYYVRSTAWLYRGVAYQMAGKLDQAYATLATGAAEDVAEDGAVRARVAGSRCFVEWMAGDLPATAQGAAHLQAVAEAHHRRESLTWAHYLLSSVAYERNDLATAEAHAQSLDGLRYLARPMAYLQSAFVHASTHAARGQPEQAQRQLGLAFDFLRATRNEGLMPLAQAFQAELAVRQGDLGAARHWATAIGPFLPLGLMPYFYAPQLTLPKILLAQDTPASRAQAADVLSRLHAFVTATHNIRFTIEVLALQAMLHGTQGAEQEALTQLRQALTLAEPGGFIRLFVDLGPRLAALCSRLRQTGLSSRYLDQLVQAFGDSTPAASHPYTALSAREHLELVERLSDREMEILALLAQRLSNKEIAQTLVISVQTVKRHASNIYGKLQVDGRREAVVKATRLGLI